MQMLWDLVLVNIAFASGGHGVHSPTFAHGSEIMDSAELPERGSVLLQIHGTTVQKLIDQGRSSVAGIQAPLNASGYASVNAECCEADVDKWLTRLFISKSWELCFRGGLNGFLPWVTCRQSYTYEMLITELEAALTAPCPWLRRRGDCPTLRPESCPRKPDNPSWHRRRSCHRTSQPPTTITTTTLPIPCSNITLCPPHPKICCTRDATLLQTVSQPVLQASAVVVKHASRADVPESLVTNVSKFDCASTAGPVQVLDAGDRFDVKELELATGRYNLLYSLPLEMTDPPYTVLNSVSVNPIDGVAYGTLKINSWSYLVRFDKTRIEFVVKLPTPYPSGNDIVGCFNEQGTYYVSLNKLGSSHLWRAQKLHTMQGYDIHTNSALTNRQNMPSYEIKGTGGFADCVGVTRDFEQTGTPSEFVLALSPRSKLVMIKDLGTTFQHWTLPTDPVQSKFGSGWNFQGRIYFAGNNGRGVYEVPLLGLSTKTALVKLNRVGLSEQTMSNDGMNCMNSESPFPNCELGLNDIPANADGTCPAGSTPANSQ